jgi:hypothetical protein
MIQGPSVTSLLFPGPSQGKPCKLQIKLPTLQCGQAYHAGSASPSCVTALPHSHPMGNSGKYWKFSPHLNHYWKLDSVQLFILVQIYTLRSLVPSYTLLVCYTGGQVASKPPCPYESLPKYLGSPLTLHTKHSCLSIPHLWLLFWPWNKIHSNADPQD